MKRVPLIRDGPIVADAFSYRLVCLTHGASETLAASLRAFAKLATPAPAETVIVVDGRSDWEVFDRLIADHPPCFDMAVVKESALQEGFCKATARAWTEAAREGVEWSFYLEGDFTLMRPLDVSAMAAVLTEEEGVAQMVLKRQAVNAQEIAAGGLMEARPGEFEQRETFGLPWAIQRSFLSTNPFLSSRDWFEQHPWPDYPENCEGLFGADLRADGWAFGMWGKIGDAPLVEHVGVRTGTGY